MADNQGTTQDLLDGRAATYGPRVQNMDSMARMVNAYLDAVEVRTGKRELAGEDFAMIMVLYKVYRFGATPDYRDNIADVFGYAQIAEECVGDRMIEAGSAKEYQQIKAERSLETKEEAASAFYAEVSAAEHKAAIERLLRPWGARGPMDTDAKTEAPGIIRLPDTKPFGGWEIQLAMACMECGLEFVHIEYLNELEPAPPELDVECHCPRGHLHKDTFTWNGEKYE